MSVPSFAAETCRLKRNMSLGATIVQVWCHFFKGMFYRQTIFDRLPFVPLPQQKHTKQKQLAKKHGESLQQHPSVPTSVLKGGTDVPKFAVSGRWLLGSRRELLGCRNQLMVVGPVEARFLQKI